MDLPNNIGIIGMGLIGGSITKALKKRAPTVAIASLHRDCLDLHDAAQQKAVDRLFSSWKDLIAWSDMIVLASPLATLSSLAEEIAKRCPRDKKLIVIDVSSVKKAVFPCFETLSTQNLDFLSTHPMAGKEKWGFANSDADLFVNCSWVLSPHAKNKQASIHKVSHFIETLGAKPMQLDAQQHDEKAALISHLPALLSRLLLNFVEQSDPECLKMAGPGFQSMTRLARDNPELHREIARLNHKELSKQLSKFLEFITAAQEEKK